MSGMFRSLKSKAQDEDWMGKAKSAATQATTTAQQAAGQATAQAKQRDQATLEKTGPLPEGAVWRGAPWGGATRGLCARGASTNGPQICAAGLNPQPPNQPSKA